MPFESDLSNGVVEENEQWKINLKTKENDVFFLSNYYDGIHQFVYNIYQPNINYYTLKVKQNDLIVWPTTRVNLGRVISPDAADEYYCFQPFTWQRFAVYKGNNLTKIVNCKNSLSLFKISKSDELNIINAKENVVGKNDALFLGQPFFYDYQNKNNFAMVKLITHQAQFSFKDLVVDNTAPLTFEIYKDNQKLDTSQYVLSSIAIIYDSKLSDFKNRYSYLGGLANSNFPDNYLITKEYLEYLYIIGEKKGVCSKLDKYDLNLQVIYTTKSNLRKPFYYNTTATYENQSKHIIINIE